MEYRNPFCFYTLYLKYVKCKTPAKTGIVPLYLNTAESTLNRWTREKNGLKISWGVLQRTTNADR